jgi:hypothetical protein
MSKEIQFAVAGLAVLAFLAFVISRQVARRTVTPKRLVMLPAAFTVLALVVDGGFAARLDTPVAVAFFVGGLVLAVPLGVARAATMRVWRTPDATLAQGGRRTVLLWVLTIAVRIGVLLVAARSGAPEGAGEAMLFVAATIAAQNAVIARRAGLLGAPAAAPAAPETAELEPVR